MFSACSLTCSMLIPLDCRHCRLFLVIPCTAQRSPAGLVHWCPSLSIQRISHGGFILDYRSYPTFAFITVGLLRLLTANCLQHGVLTRRCVGVREGRASSGNHMRTGRSLQVSSVAGWLDGWVCGSDISHKSLSKGPDRTLLSCVDSDRWAYMKYRLLRSSK